MGTLQGSPSPPALRLRRAKPTFANAILIAVLRRVRRRLRLRRALDAAVLGGTVALAVAAAAGRRCSWAGRAEAGLGVAPAAPRLALAARLGLLLAGGRDRGPAGGDRVAGPQREVELTAAATAVDRWLGRQAAGR